MADPVARFLNHRHWGDVLRHHLNSTDTGVYVGSPTIIWNCKFQQQIPVLQEDIINYENGSLSAVWLDDVSRNLGEHIKQWWKKLRPGGFLGGPSWGYGPLPDGRFAVDTRSMIQQSISGLSDSSECFTGNEAHPCWLIFKRDKTQKILIISGSDDHQAESFGYLSRANHEFYARSHGYDYRWVHLNKEEWKSPLGLTWAKITSVNDALKEQQWDQVWWLDADAVFLNMDKKIDGFLHPDWHGVFPEFIRDHNVMLSTGVFGCRTGASSLLDTVWNTLRETPPPSCEENAIGRLLRRNHEPWKHVQAVEHSLFNGFYGWMVKHDDTQRNFICHLVGKTNKERAQVFSQINQFHGI